MIIVKTIKNLENKMEKMQESMNKDLEELKNKHTETNNIITEIKNTLWRRKWQPTAVFLLQYPMDRGDWQATVYRVRKSWTRLKELSTHISPTVAQEITKCEDVLKNIRLL